MKENSQVLRVPKVPDSRRRLTRLRLYRPCPNDSTEVLEQAFWLAWLLPVGHPFIAYRAATLRAAILTRWTNFCVTAELRRIALRFFDHLVGMIELNLDESGCI